MQNIISISGSSVPGVVWNGTAEEASIIGQICPEAFLFDLSFNKQRLTCDSVSEVVTFWHQRNAHTLLLSVGLGRKSVACSVRKYYVTFMGYIATTITIEQTTCYEIRPVQTVSKFTLLANIMSAVV